MVLVNFSLIKNKLADYHTKYHSSLKIFPPVYLVSLKMEDLKPKKVPPFGYFFSADVFFLRLIGASSMIDVLTDNPRKERRWELMAFLFFTLLPCFVLFSEFATVYFAAHTDLNYMIEALTATFSGLLSIMKVT